jgi:branched-chain amino acid aminotransferase
MDSPLAYINGEIVPEADAHISVLDLGVVRGFGIYEGITSFAGKLFRFNDHWERFQGSAKVLGLSIPHTKEEIETALHTLGTQETQNGRVNFRLVLTGGEAVGGLEHVPGHETLFITAAPHTPIAEEVYAHGASLITHGYQRFMPEVKTIHYIPAVLLQQKRKDAGAIEILYTHNDQVLECATSNVFMVKDNTVITPDTKVLKGITRKVVLELATGTYETEETSIPVSAFLEADEIFITSSFKDIVPIVSIDGRRVGSGVPGPVTQELMKRFTENTKSF